MISQSNKKLRILLAEDEAVSRLAVGQFLSKMGHQTTAVSNGREALKSLAATPHDCVLMDIQMPVMDGLDATRAIRSGAVPGSEDIHIIALTAHAMRGDKESFLEAGMNGYLSKPVDLFELERVLADLTKTQ